MPPVKPGHLTLPSRSEPAVREIASAWRRLTSPRESSTNGPGAPTIVACSGGGDSSALLIALAAAAGRRAPGLLTVAHVVHDLRSAEHAHADRDKAASLAAALGLRFVQATVSVKNAAGNAEGNARSARYKALRSIAQREGVAYIATAHNSHDQVESVLMALLRGAGPKGLSGIASKRRLAPGIEVIRPMLSVTPSDARTLCDRAGWAYAIDATNSDTARLRSALRSDIVPRLFTLRPGAEQRIASAAQQCRSASEAVARVSRRLLKHGRTSSGYEWTRERLRSAPPAVLGDALRRAASRLAGRAVLDKLPSRTVAAAVRLIQSGQTDPKVLQWSGIAVRVTAHTVTMTAAKRVKA